VIKRCVECGYDLHINAFSLVHGSGKSYRLHACKMCWSERRKEWRRKRAMPAEDWALYMRRYRLARVLRRA
jgi:hypothetical protein